MKKTIILWLIAMKGFGQQTETVTSVVTQTLNPPNSVSTLTSVTTRTVSSSSVSPRTAKAVAALTPIGHDSLSVYSSGTLLGRMAPNKANHLLQHPALTRTGTLSTVVLRNKSADTVYRVRLKPNQSVVFPVNDTEAVKLTNKGRGRIVIRLKPQGELSFARSAANVTVTNTGTNCARFGIHKKAILSMVKVTSDAPKIAGNASLVLGNKEDTLVVVKNISGSAFTYTNADGVELKFDKQGVHLNKTEGLSLSVSPKAKKQEEPPADFIARIFNDAKGFDPKQPNGLIQTELALNVNITKKLHIQLGNDWSLYFLRNALFPCVNLFRTKSDSSFRYAPVHYATRGGAIIDSTVNIHTLSLVRYASWCVASKLNILTFQNREKSITAYLDGYGVFYGTGLSYDSLAIAHYGIRAGDSKFTVYSVGGGLAGKVRVGAPRSNFSVEASVTSYGLKLLSSSVKQNYGRFYEPDYNMRNDEVGNLNFEPRHVSYFRGITSYGLQVRYSSKPNKENPAGSGIFFRIIYHTNPFPLASTISYGNSFIQIQTGISMNIKDLLTSAGLAEPK